jgi:hypothetical protein
MMLKDESGQPSLTRTLYAAGFIICSIKLLLAGIQVGGFKMSDFSGIDFGAAIAALGGVYHMKKVQDTKKAE